MVLKRGKERRNSKKKGGELRNPVGPSIARDRRKGPHGHKQDGTREGKKRTNGINKVEELHRRHLLRRHWKAFKRLPVWKNLFGKKGKEVHHTQKKKQEKERGGRGSKYQESKKKRASETQRGRKKQL